jgi:uncharacterized protein GlcG (DUF336 family)
MNKHLSTLLFSPLVVLVSAAMALTAYGQSFINQKNITLEAARIAAQAALDECDRLSAIPIPVSVAIVDRAGVLKTQLRQDGAGPHTTDSSFRKAYTAASLKRATGDLADAVVGTVNENLQDMNDNVLILRGGVPIVHASGEVIGGIGVGGKPFGSTDEACAIAGRDAITGGPPR